jgi:hypothetical protein
MQKDILVLYISVMSLIQRIHWIKCFHRVTITPCAEVLLEKLTVPQLIKKFPKFYET